MKYYYPLLILVAALSLLFSFMKLKTANNRIEEFSGVNKILSLESENYLKSLASGFPIKEDFIINSLTGETMFLSETKRPCLCYFFSSADCMSCVEENIFFLIKLVKNKNLLNVLVITTMEKSEYLKSMSNIQDASFINFGICSNEINLDSSFYFMIFGSGDISNIYFPRKGEMESTLRYLDKVCKVLKN